MTRMEINTTRFGRVTLNDERVITFPSGLLGFPNQTRFALIQYDDKNYFYYLQAIDDPALAFVVTDPGIFFGEYEVPVAADVVKDLAVRDVSQVQVFVICNKVDEWLTGNLLGPIVVNAANRLGQQVVLTGSNHSTRTRILELPKQVLMN